MSSKSNNFFSGAALVGLAALPVVGVSTAAFASDAKDGNVSVSERSRPGYDQVGIRLGAFTLKPELNLGYQSNDNVFSTATGEQSDTAFTYDPSVVLESDWSTHALSLFANAQNRRYQDFDVQDTTVVTAGGEGRLDFSRDVNFGGDLSFTSGEEALGQQPALGLAEPVEYARTLANAKATWNMARTRLSARIGSDTFDYDDGASLGGGNIDQDFRDRTVVSGQVRGDLGVSPDTALFLAVGANDRSYDQAPTFGAPNRDSDGYEVLVGANFDISRLVRGDIGIGYFSQSFASGGDDLEEFAVQGVVEWFPTQLVTVTGSASRGVGDSSLGAATSSILSRGGVRVDYEFARNVIFGAKVDYTQDDYQGLDRTDTRWESGGEVQYMLNRSVAVFGSALVTNQSSDGTATGREYDQNVFTIGLRLRR